MFHSIQEFRKECLGHKSKMAFIKFQSAEGDLVHVEVAAVERHSKTIRTMLDDLQIDRKQDLDEVIHLPHISGKTLDDLVAWMTHHTEDIMADKGEDTLPLDMEIPLSKWDKEFLGNLDNADLFNLILAANYFEMEGLMAMACKTVSDSMIDKSQEELMEMFSAGNRSSSRQEMEFGKGTLIETLFNFFNPRCNK